jgi:hypothetical protein
MDPPAGCDHGEIRPDLIAEARKNESAEPGAIPGISALPRSQFSVFSFRLEKTGRASHKLTAPARRAVGLARADDAPMTPPDQSPKLPLWVFLVTDAVLLFTAWFIASSSARPLSGNAILIIAGCVVAGALLATIPIIAHYERVKNETLDDRQRSLETLSHTIAASAEQISVAAHGLHEIVELAQRNLKAAEHLPQKLQEKIAAFKAQLDAAGDDGREELEKEVGTLRAAESERLESAADKMAKAVAELTRLEASAHKHLAASTAALEKATAAVAATEAAAANHRSQI